MSEEKYDPALLRALLDGNDATLDIFVHFEHPVTEDEARALAAEGGLRVAPGKTLTTARLDKDSIRSIAGNAAVRYMTLGKRTRMLP